MAKKFSSASFRQCQILVDPYNWLYAFVGQSQSSCTSTNQCEVGEGDCDSDIDCKGNLVCGEDNCVGGTFESDDDCCDNPTGEHLYYPNVP